MKTKLPDNIRLNSVRLIVRDLDRLVGFYSGQLGFHIHRSETDSASLGSGEGEPFLHLAQETSATLRPPAAPGLFHTAFLYEDRAKLATTLRNIIRKGVVLEGFADHLVSEAIYLRDPEGNGIELYRDRPREEWPYRNGHVAMATDPLDVDGLLREPVVDDETARRGLKIGHIHLQTGDLSRAEEFWSKMIGFDVVQRSYPGALFVSAGGYHHHIGLNTWRSKGTSLPVGLWTGLSELAISLPRQTDLDDVRTRLSDGSKSPEPTFQSFYEGTSILFTAHTTA